jgi:thiol:disulfide interchange protein
MRTSLCALIESQRAPWRWLVAVLAAVIALAWPAAAQPDFPSRVQLSLDANVKAIQPNEPFAIAVTFEIEEGWKINTNDPKVPASWGDIPLLPTTIALDEASAKLATLGSIQWPKTKTAQADLAGNGKPESYEVFAGTAVAFVPVRLKPDAFGPDGKATLTFKIGFQACDATTCEMPMREDLAVSVPQGAASPAAAGLFRDFDVARLQGSEQWGSAATASSGSAGNASNGAGLPAAPRSFFGIPLPGSGGMWTWLVFFALAALGGFVLNLTPCVLPVLPLKVMAIVQHAGSPKRTLYLGMWMAAGVIAFWVACAVPVLVLSSFADPSRIFGIWWVTLGLGLLIAIMSVGLMGVFNITLPQAVYAVNPKADSAGGSFLFGIMTAVLGLPCFGFVAGSLLAAAATLPKIVTFAIFLGLGVGMALPYFVLALKPHWIKKIPRTGPASELIKQVMGLLLLAAGIFFIGAGLIALVAAKPWIAKQLHVWIAALIALIAGLWIISRTFQISKSTLPRAIFTVIGLFVASAGLWYANDTTTRARDNYLSGMWAPYSPQAVAAARAEGKVVVLDFTAEWCLNCKALKAAVLDREPVKSRLREQNIALFLVDLTATEAPGWKRLEELGQTGIPLLAIYTPGEPQPWLANNYTADTVMAAVNRALQVADAARKASTETAQLPSGR